MNKSIRTAIFIMVAYFFISSKMFNETILKNIPGALEYENPSDKGIFIGSVFMALIFLLINFLVNADFI